MAERTPLGVRLLRDGANLVQILSMIGGALLVLIGFTVWLTAMHQDVQQLKADVSAIRSYLMPADARQPGTPQGTKLDRLSETNP